MPNDTPREHCLFDLPLTGAIVEWVSIAILVASLLAIGFTQTDLAAILSKAVRGSQTAFMLLIGADFLLYAAIVIGFGVRQTEQAHKGEQVVAPTRRLKRTLHIAYHALRWPVAGALALSGNSVLIYLSVSFDLAFAAVFLVLWGCGALARLLWRTAQRESTECDVCGPFAFLAWPVIGALIEWSVAALLMSAWFAYALLATDLPGVVHAQIHPYTECLFSANNDCRQWGSTSYSAPVFFYAGAAIQWIMAMVLVFGNPYRWWCPQKRHCHWDVETVQVADTSKLHDGEWCARKRLMHWLYHAVRWPLAAAMIMEGKTMVWIVLAFFLEASVVATILAVLLLLQLGALLFGCVSYVRKELTEWDTFISSE